MTAEDIPGENVVSSIKDDMPALAAGTIRHHSEPVALVAAPDKATLREARRRIRTTHRAARRRSSTRSSRSSSSRPTRSPAATSRQAFEEATLVVQGEYRVGHQEQLYIENQAMIAEPRPDGGITITGSMQCPYYVHDGAQARPGPE